MSASDDASQKTQMGVVQSGVLAADAGDGREAARRRAILVLGVHRSGTSALTRLLALCGANLPQRLMEPNYGNPKGYWEPLDIVEIHDQMLAAAGSAWDDAAGFSLSWLDAPEAQTFRSRLCSTFQEAFGNAPLAVLKDPRICQFVPLWTSILQSLEIVPLFVIPVRNPLEVAASLKARDEQGPANLLGPPIGMPEARALLLWLRCFLDAERYTRGFPRSFVSYEALMSDWRAVVVKMGDDLAITWPVPSDHIAPEVEDFLSADMRHHVSSTEELQMRADIAPWFKEAYRWAQNAAAGQVGDTEELDRLHASLRQADMVFRPVLAANMIEKRRAAAALEQQIAERHAVVAELRKEIESTAGQVGTLREEADARIRTLGALQGQLSEAAARFAEQLRDLRQSEEAVDIGVAPPAPI